MSDPKQLQHKTKVPLKRALLAILLSVCLISGSFAFVLIYYHHLRENQRSDPSYQIVAVVQTSPDREGLKTSFLAEALELSIDRPRHLYDYNTREARQKLMQLPMIKEADVQKIRPGTLHVDYILRKPIAFLGDFTNAAIDASGVMFPIKPFYTPKKLPEIILGDDFEGTIPAWGTVLNGEGKKLAFLLLDLIPQYVDETSSVKSIDVSNAFAPSDGQRQIVIVLEDRQLRVVDGETVLSIHPRILRLRQENLMQQLGNYLVLRSHLREQDRLLPLTGKGTIRRVKAVIIDLRLSELAFFNREP